MAHKDFAENWNQIYSRGEQLNKYPYDAVVSFLNRSINKQSNRGLDIGCGSGIHSKLMSDFGLTVLAFDGSIEGVKAAQERYINEPNIEFEHQYFDQFESTHKFDICVDRFATSQSSIPTTIALYKKLKKNLNVGARLFWQGFDLEDSGRKYATKVTTGRWDDFTGGEFEGLGGTAFFGLNDVNEIFHDFRILDLQNIRKTHVGSNYVHVHWQVEAIFDGDAEAN